MPRTNVHDIVNRWDGNPILTIEDLPFNCLGLHNAAAVKVDGTYLLLLRVEGMEGKSFFILARSENGFQFTVDEDPVMLPSDDEAFGPYETLGIEDPRITAINGEFFVTYTAHSASGSRLAIAVTKDFKTFERVAFVTQPENRSGALMPRKFNGRYALLDRPLVGDSGDLWITYSRDLKYWGDSKVVLSTRGGFWDSYRIGVGCPPIATEKGWVLVYYGTKNTSGGLIYRIGSALLDLNDPSKVLGRCEIPILSPREYYERVGDVDNLVFTTGAILDENLGNLMIYYGAATNSICLGLTKIDMLIERCLQK